MPRDPSPDAPLRLAWSRGRERVRLAEASDAELLVAVRDGDEAAFDILVERATPDLLRWVGRYLGDLDEARDVVQAAFLRVWRRRRRYDPKRGGGRSWLLSIATNLAIDRLRQLQRRRRAHEQAAAQHGLLAAVGPERWSGAEVERLFRSLARGLSPRQQAAFLMREVEELPTREVAEVLGCDPSTVRSLVSQARTALRRELRRRFPEYLPASHPPVSGTGPGPAHPPASPDHGAARRGARGDATSKEDAPPKGVASGPVPDAGGRGKESVPASPHANSEDDAT